MKELTTREIAAVKRQFKNSLPAIKKIESIDQKIAKLQEERAIQQAILDGGEAGIMAMTGGYKSIDLITCTYEPQFNEDGSPKMDKEGKYQQKKRVLTFVVPVQKPTEEAESEETTTESNKNDLKSEEEVFPDNLNNVENM